MKILAVDTSTNVASCAITDDEKLICESTVNDKVTHSQKLLPLIADTLKRSKLKPEDIDIFAVANGPGSFTGLRIGVTTINSLAQATDKRVVGVSSLEALAQSVSVSEKLVVPLIDARRDRAFTAIYSFKRGLMDIHRDPDVLEITELIDILNTRDENILFIGEGVSAYKEVLEAELGEKAYFADEITSIASASSVARLALEKAKNNDTQSYFELVPDYLREAQAQREYDEKMSKQND